MPEGRREPKKVLLRLDPAVHEALAKWAADEFRSVNSQIEFALRLALKQVGRDVRAKGAKETDARDEDADQPQQG